MLRMSTTTLESFRLWRDGDWMAEDDLLLTIRGVFTPTPAINLGSAFGKVLETPDRYRVDGGYRITVNRQVYTFDDVTMAPALALMDHTHGCFEAKATKAYDDCLVVSKADQIVGAHLYEHKTTCGSFDFEKYADSYQWRFMADAFEPLAITYHIFLLEDHENGVASLRGIESFDLYPYAALHQDCADLVAAFRAYVVTKGLDGLLRQRQMDVEAA